MTSIFSGQLYRTFVADQNQLRLANFNVNRFQKTIEQSAAQGRLEKELREGLEYHQAIMADLQTKLNELTEKLNNLYRSHMDNEVAFRKVSQEEEYIGTSKVLNNLRNVTDATPPTNSNYPAGAAGITPFDDPGRVKNYTYNPFFGSKAIDESDQVLNRTYWEQPGVTSESAYRENGAFWSSIAYLWSWDLDRINATYTTTDSNQQLFGNSDLILDNVTGLQVGGRVQATIGGQTYIKTVTSIDAGDNSVLLSSGFPIIPPAGTTLTFQDAAGATVGTGDVLAGSGNGLADDYTNLQVNVTALQPNKEQYPPLRAGDRFPIRSTQTPDTTGAPNPPLTYPSIGLSGIRPGGTDYSHAQNTESLNEVGEDSLNWGWEFDDLPLALEVTDVDVLDDGTTRPLGYKVVYDIPSTHPNFEQFRYLDGTEPQILDAPTALVKERVYNPGFSYSGFAELGDGDFNGVYGTTASPLPSTNDHPPGSGTSISTYPIDFASAGNKVSSPFNGKDQPTSGNMTNPDPDYVLPGHYMGTMYFDGCETAVIDANTRVSFTYDYLVTQRGQTGTYNSASDDGAIFYDGHSWGGSSASNPYLTDNTTLNTISGGPAFTDTIPFPTGGPPTFNNVVIGADQAVRLGSVNTISATGGALTKDPFHQPGGASGSLGESASAGNTGTGGSGLGPIVLSGAPTGLSVGNTVAIDGVGPPFANVTRIVGNNVYLDAPLAVATSGNLVRTDGGGVFSGAISGANTGDGEAGGVVVNDANTLPTGVPIDIRSGGAGGALIATVTITSKTGNTIFFTPPFDEATTIPDTNFFFEVQGSGATYGGGNQEDLNLKFREEGGRVAVDVYFEGDIHGLQINIDDLKIINYNGELNNWEQGLYNTDIPELGNGDLAVTGPFPLTETASVINKFEPSNYNFTQFHNDYTLSATQGDLNDILRSPYEYGLLNIGQETVDHDGDTVLEGSHLSGELYVDINNRRLNFDHDDHDNATTQPDWSATAVELLPGAASGTPGVGIAADGSDYFLGENVQEVYDFRASTHPGDHCVPPTSSAAAGTRTGQASDSDPYTDHRLDDYGDLHNTTTPADPMRASALAQAGAPADYYTNVSSGSDLNGGTGNDITGTVDRIAGTTNTGDITTGLDYGITIPTTDLNILKKDNDLVFNFGSLDGRGWSIDINEPFMEFRTVPDYQTISRYRVDDSGNIYDRFGKGFYDDDPTNLGDAAAIQDLYPTVVRGNTSELSTIPLKNGQISNHDFVYDNANYYDANGNNAQPDAMSPDNDDYNLFDYVPDLRDVIGSSEGAKQGELYVGSLPTNFYYYREELDNPAGDDSVPTVGDDERFREDGKPALNFDGRSTNTDGTLSGQHTVVHNTETPSFVNVNLGYVEQDAIQNNQASTTTFVRWTGFNGIGGENVAASRIAAESGTITNPINAVGASRQSAAFMDDGSSLTLELGTDLDQQGHLLIYESTAAAADALVQEAFVAPGSGNGATSVQLSSASFLAINDVAYYEAPSGALTQITITGVNTGTNEVTFTPPFGADLSGGKIIEITPQFTAKPHAVPLPLEDGYQFSFDSYQAAETMSRTGSVVTAGGDTVIHVDNAREFFNPPIPSPMRIVVGEAGNEQFFNITLDDINTGTHPHTVTVGGALSAANLARDVPVRMVAPTFDIEIIDGDSENSRVVVDYNENGTGLLGRLASVEASPEMDRAGRFIGDDARTAGTETDGISPEYFGDQPPGFIEPDARLDLTLRAKDKDGNQAPRRLKEIVVTVGAGEQIILGGPAGDISQTYRTSQDLDRDGTVSAAEAATMTTPTGDWPIALYDAQNRLINTSPTDDLGILVGYFQGIVNSDPVPVGPTTTVELASVGEFQIDDIVTVNGEQRTITNVDAGTNTITLNEELSAHPRNGDSMHLGRGDGEIEIAAFLNRSFAMSTNSPVDVEFVWEDYEVTGYPPVVATTGVDNTENVGFTKTDPAADVADTEYDAMNYLVTNNGRSGGSSSNEFTNELKRIVDNPEYKELLRHDLMKNIFITASVSDPFNDVIASKIIMNWDRLRRRTELMQSSFTAYYQSI